MLPYSCEREAGRKRLIEDSITVAAAASSASADSIDQGCLSDAAARRVPAVAATVASTRAPRRSAVEPPAGLRRTPSYRACERGQFGEFRARGARFSPTISASAASRRTLA
jgi:hypothetical protein